MKKFILAMCLIAVMTTSVSAGWWFQKNRLDLTVRGGAEVTTNSNFNVFSGVTTVELVFDRISQLDKLMRFGNFTVKPYIGTYLFSFAAFYNPIEKKVQTNFGSWWGGLYSGLNVEYKVDSKSKQKVVLGFEKNMNDYYSYSVKLGYKTEKVTTGVRLNNLGYNNNFGVYANYDIYNLKYKY